MSKVAARVYVTLLLLCGAAGVYAGGWSIITVKDFPDSAVAGQPVTLKFSVRQHGTTLTGGLKPVVYASTAGGREITAAATPTVTKGEYSATLGFPSPGDWTLRIDGGFNTYDVTRQSNSLVLPVLSVVRDASTVRPAYSEAQRGGRLMVSKGCVGCHKSGQRSDVTQKRFTASYLRALLTDPGSRRVDMPNLALEDAEISALIVFFNASRHSSATHPFP